MIRVIINDKKYNIPNSYKDVTLKRFKQIQDFLYSEHNKDKTESIINGDVKDEEEALQFFVEFINYVTGIPTKELKKVRRFTKDDEIGIEDLFYSMSFLFVIPNIESPEPVEKIGDYYFIDKTDLTQAELKDATVVEYTEANAVIKAFNKLSEGRYEYLNLLLGIMYRPKKKKWYQRKYRFEEYDGDKVKERIKFFDNVTMDVVWNCLFFFTQLKIKSLKDTEVYLEEVVAKAQID